MQPLTQHITDSNKTHTGARKALYGKARKAWLVISLTMISGWLCSPLYANDPDRKISPAKWEQMTQDKAFGYRHLREGIVKYEVKPPTGLAKFFRALFQFFGSAVGSTLIWVAIIAVVIFVVYKLFFSDGSFLFGKSKKMATDTGTAEHEELDMTTTNWEELLEQARKNNDHRLAVRYSYMRLLQLLQQRELIKYRNDKTNYDYYAELSETNYKLPFKQLSRQYEYTWYGKFEIASGAFSDYLALFNNVKRQLGA